jgi:hypothetical protein
MCDRKGELKVRLVPMEMKPDDSLVTLHGLAPDTYLELTVSDTGTGMGLSVVHGIVKSCHGAITVESKEACTIKININIYGN